MKIENNINEIHCKQMNEAYERIRESGLIKEYIYERFSKELIERLEHVRRFIEAYAFESFSSEIKHRNDNQNNQNPKQSIKTST